MKTKIAIVDDHELMVRALSRLIHEFDGYQVIIEAFSGKDLMHYIGLSMIPEIVLLDINMPEMDGYDVAQWLKLHHKEIRILALSMDSKEEAIVKMLRNGAGGYLLKNCKPSELKSALDSIKEKGFYYTEYITSQLIRNLNTEKNQDPRETLGINERELTFIRLSCSDLTYVEIADKMCVSPRTVDGYRESIFLKMNVKSRVGMVLEAIRLGLFKI